MGLLRALALCAFAALALVSCVVADEHEWQVVTSFVESLSTAEQWPAEEVASASASAPALSPERAAPHTGTHLTFDPFGFDGSLARAADAAAIAASFPAAVPSPAPASSPAPAPLVRAIPSACTSRGGVCQSSRNACANGRYFQGLCPGAADNQCCLLNSKISPSPKPGTNPPAQRIGGWTSLGNGVSASLGSSGGCRSLLAFGGYTYRLTTSQTWVRALATRANVQATWGVDSLFAVKGPQEVLYDSAEISTSAIARALQKVATNTAACPRPLLIVAAHSSGAYVAHEFITHVHKLAPALLPRMVYFNLDGGNGGIAASTINRLGLYVPVSAHVSGMTAHNYGSMKSSFTSAPRRQFIDINASGSRCQAPMCLHMTMVNKVPFLPGSWGERDAYDFSQGHAVQADYISTVAAKITALAK